MPMCKTPFISFLAGRNFFVAADHRSGPDLDSNSLTP